MTYPTFEDSSIPMEEVSIKDITCPICGGQKTQEFLYCNYDCYTDSKHQGKHKKIVNDSIESYSKEGKKKISRKINYPILRGRDFKHIPPYDHELKFFDGLKKKWVFKEESKRNNNAEFNCPEAGEKAHVDYCESFSFGDGCRFLKTCSAYREHKTAK